jgi:hypothetical protein
MNVWVVCVIMLAVVFLIVLLCLADIKLSEKSKKSRGETMFDERQLSAQYKAGSFAGMAAMFYFAAMFVFCSIFEEQGLPINSLILPTGGLFFYSVSYNLYCLFTDAIQPLNMDIVCAPIWFTISGALNIARGVWRGNLPISGEGSDQLVDLLLGITIFFNGVIGVISYILEKRKNGQE